LLPFTAQAAPKAKITPQQAKASAVKKIPGKATTAKYEFEDGHWQYAVAVMGRKGGMYEVEVNAQTGLVTDTEKTTPGEEAREAAADKKAAMKGHVMPSAEKGEAGETNEKGEAGEKGG
jgi:hypothetical protein